MANSNGFGMVKSLRIGKSNAALLLEQKDVQRLPKVNYSNKEH